MLDDLFVSVPEFLAAFDNILKNGFFEEIQFNTGGKAMEGQIHGCSISATGCVPDNKKYKVDGCGAVIDPHMIISSCRKLADQKKVKSITTKVETTVWPLWSSNGEKIVGTKGKRTEMSLYVTFKI